MAISKEEDPGWVSRNSRANTASEDARTASREVTRLNGLVDAARAAITAAEKDGDQSQIDAARTNYRTVFDEAVKARTKFTGAASEAGRAKSELSSYEHYKGYIVIGIIVGLASTASAAINSHTPTNPLAVSHSDPAPNATRLVSSPNSSARRSSQRFTMTPDPFQTSTWISPNGVNQQK